MDPVLPLSDGAQQAIAAYRIIQHIRSFKAHEERFTSSHPHQFQQELIQNQVVPSVVTKQNFDKIMKIFNLRHDLDPNTPLLQFTTQKQASSSKKNDDCNKISYYPTETTKTLFNILLNKERQSIILNRFGLTKNIVIYLLWHLSAIITQFKISEQFRDIKTFLNIQKMAQIPKYVYYLTQNESQKQAIERLSAQCQQISLPEEQSKQVLSEFCDYIEKQYASKNIKLFYIVISSKFAYSYFINGILQQRNDQVDPRRRYIFMDETSFKNVGKILVKDRQINIRPELALISMKHNAYLTKLIPPFEPQSNFYVTEDREVYAFNQYASNMVYCQLENKLINYQRKYFLLKERKCGKTDEWPIQSVREVFKELSVLMHDDEQFYSFHRDEISFIKQLARENSETFTSLEASFISRTLGQQVTNTSTFIELPSEESQSNLSFSTQCVENDIDFILENLKKYLSVTIQSESEFQSAFYCTMARLMAYYPQELTLRLGGKDYRIKAEFNSAYYQITEGSDPFQIETHLASILEKIFHEGPSQLYLSSIPHSSRRKTRYKQFYTGNPYHLSDGNSTNDQCFDCILMRLDKGRNEYDLISIEWAFEKELSAYWMKSEELQKKISESKAVFQDRNIYRPYKSPILPRIQRAIAAQSNAHTDLSIQREHFIVCPARIIKELSNNEEVHRLLNKPSQKWKITLAPIEEIRFTDFSYQNKDLKSSVNQLFEHFTLSNSDKM